MPTCICGREMGPKAHCPVCGSNFSYATPSRDKIIRVNEEEYVARAYNCRFCGTSYNESDKCIARPPKKRRDKTPTAKRFVSPENLARATSEAASGVVKLWKERMAQGRPPNKETIEKCKSIFGIDLELELGIETTPAATLEDPFSDEPQIHIASLEDPIKGESK